MAQLACAPPWWTPILLLWLLHLLPSVAASFLSENVNAADTRTTLGEQIGPDPADPLVQVIVGYKNVNRSDSLYGSQDDEMTQLLTSTVFRQFVQDNDESFTLLRAYRRVNSAAVVVRQSEIPLLEQSEMVDYVEADETMYLMQATTGSETISWGIPAIQANSPNIPLPPPPTSWDACFKVCVVDSGLSTNHPDIVRLRGIYSLSITGLVVLTLYLARVCVEDVRSLARKCNGRRIRAPTGTGMWPVLRSFSQLIYCDGNKLPTLFLIQFLVLEYSSRYSRHSCDRDNSSHWREWARCGGRCTLSWHLSLDCSRLW
jgi:Peptidase inhibitor I9